MNIFFQFFLKATDVVEVTKGTIIADAMADDPSMQALFVPYATRIPADGNSIVQITELEMLKFLTEQYAALKNKLDNRAECIEEQLNSWSNTEFHTEETLRDGILFLCDYIRSVKRDAAVITTLKTALQTIHTGVEILKTTPTPGTDAKPADYMDCTDLLLLLIDEGVAEKVTPAWLALGTAVHTHMRDMMVQMLSGLDQNRATGVFGNIAKALKQGKIEIDAQKGTEELKLLLGSFVTGTIDGVSGALSGLLGYKGFDTTAILRQKIYVEVFKNITKDGTPNVEDIPADKGRENIRIAREFYAEYPEFKVAVCNLLTSLFINNGPANLSTILGYLLERSEELERKHTVDEQKCADANAYFMVRLKGINFADVVYVAPALKGVEAEIFAKAVRQLAEDKQTWTSDTKQWDTSAATCRLSTMKYNIEATAPMFTPPNAENLAQLLTLTHHTEMPVPPTAHAAKELSDDDKEQPEESMLDLIKFFANDKNMQAIQEFFTAMTSLIDAHRFPLTFCMGTWTFNVLDNEHCTTVPPEKKYNRYYTAPK